MNSTIFRGSFVPRLDSTPEVAPFGLLSYNLRKKQALLAEATASRLVETPADPPMRARVSTEVDGYSTYVGGPSDLAPQRASSRKAGRSSRP